MTTMTPSDDARDIRPTLDPDDQERVLELRQCQSRIRWRKPMTEALLGAGLPTMYRWDDWMRLPWYGPLSVLLQDYGETLSEVIGNGSGQPFSVIDMGTRMSTGMVVHDEWLSFIQTQCLLRTGLITPTAIHAWPGGHAALGTVDERLRFAFKRPPMTPLGPTMTIRVLPSPTRWPTLSQIVEQDVLHQHGADLLLLALRRGATLLIAGGTGSGKTTLTGALLKAIEDEQRFVLIEEASELPRLADCVRTEVLRSGYDFSFCVRFALREKPDRIVVGEVRGPEAMAMIMAAATGHPSVCTIHAPDCQTALLNLERLASQSGEMRPEMVRGLMTSKGMNLVVVHLGIIQGKRRVTAIAEAIHDTKLQAGALFSINPLLMFDHERGWVLGKNVAGEWGAGIL